MSEHERFSRRTLLQASGATTLAALAGCFDPNYGSGAPSPADDTVEPDYGDWFEDANGYEATEDRREDGEVTILVGAGDDGLAYDPAAVAVAPGANLVFEWTGEGGTHNVDVRDGPADIEYEDLEDEAGFTHEASVDEDAVGITRYFCTPHEGQGMKAALVVADPEDDLGEFAAGDEAEDDTDDEDDDTDADAETYDGWLDDVPGYDGPVDATDEDTVTVGVGTGDNGLLYDPVAVQVTPGTTVVWEWTGEGGAHNVVTQDGPADLESELEDSDGFEYEFEFTDDHVGVTAYSCTPHEAQGMKGVVEVVDE